MKRLNGLVITVGTAKTGRGANRPAMVAVAATIPEAAAETPATTEMTAREMTAHMAATHVTTSPHVTTAHMPATVTSTAVSRIRDRGQGYTTGCKGQRRSTDNKKIPHTVFHSFDS